MSEAREVIADWVESHGRPKILSPEEDVHLFFFADELTDSPVVLLNRNGNFARLIKADGPSSSGWRVWNTWKDLLQGDNWQRTLIFEEDIWAAIHKVPVGPKGDQPELLSLMPRGATNGSRAAVLRHQIFRVNFFRTSDGNWNKFRLNNGFGNSSMEIEGKVWESEAAFMWALDNLSEEAPPGRGRLDTNPYVRERVMEKVKVEMEAHPLFGEWG